MIRALSQRAARALRRFWRARAGIAAVEFAFILPIMLGLYFGISVLGQGLEIGRKVQLASRTLADLASQQLPANVGGTVQGNCPAGGATGGDKPCVADEDLLDFWAGAKLVMTPFLTAPNFDPTSLKATVSLVIFDNVTKATTRTSGCCRARVVWSAAFGTGATPRACGPLLHSENGINGATFMPKGNYPGGGGDPTQTGGAYSTPSGTVNKTDNYVIVADVTYTYKPGNDFKLFRWNQDANSGSGYTISETTYMTSRYDATTPIKWKYNSKAGITDYSNCPCVLSKDGTSCTNGTAKPTATAGQFNVDTDAAW